MKKRLLSILLVLCMAVSLFTVTAFAGTPVASIDGGQQFDSLQAAFDAAKEQDKEHVFLIADCVEDVTIESGYYSLYLDGHTLTGTIKLTGGTLKLNGNQNIGEAPGKVQNTGLDGKYPIWCQNGNFNLGAVEVVATGVNGTALYSNGSKLLVDSEVTVTGNVETGTNGIISITKGTFNGSLIKGANSSLEVVGGKYSVDPSAYITSGHETALNDGYYSVVKKPVSLDDLSTDASGAYLITTADDVVLFRMLLNVLDGTGFSGKVFKLTKDIDMAGITLTAAGNNSKRFMGTFDGQNHTISNVNIQASDTQYVAFFGNISSAVIKNLTLHNVTVRGSGYTAGLVGYARASTIENCRITGAILIEGTNGVAGILGGNLNASTIIGCEVSGEGTISGSYDVGGVVGLCNGATELKGNSVEDIDIESKIGYTGGIAGRVLVGASGINASENIVKDITVTADSSDYASAMIFGGTQTTNGPVKLNGNAAIESKLTIAGEEKNNLYDEECEQSDNVVIIDAVAEVDGTPYTDIKTALKAAKENSIINLLKDITISEAWDNRYTGAKITKPVTINGNDHTITFNCNVSDGGNYHAPFRFEAPACVYNLTIDMSSATNSTDATRLRAISAKADLTVDGCTLIGNPLYTNTRAIIFGEGSDHNPETDISITNCKFINWRCGVTDNENGKDVGTVTISDNTFTNAGVQVSASDKVTFTGNDMTGSRVSITSYTASEDLEVKATGNTLDETRENVINVPITEDDEVDLGFTAIFNKVSHYFVSFELPVGAKVEVYDADGNVYTPVNGLYVLPNGTYTYTVSKFGYFDVNGCFTVAGGAQTVTVDDMIFIPNVLAVLTGATAPKAADSFVDVDANAWYYDAVNYVLDNGLMNGMSEDTFAPNGTMTRAMVWTVLGRMAGQEFNGIGANWYTEAQNWAILNGISDGTNPNGAITREELVTMLWRFVGQPEGDVSVLQWYGDTGSVSDWAAEAMAWAVNSNIIQGTDWNLNPGSVALRAQVAAILMRYCG